eukprot:scaffold189472_cov32-Tisochrysis_lutea.AAC.2
MSPASLLLFQWQPKPAVRVFVNNPRRVAPRARRQPVDGRKSGEARLKKSAQERLVLGAIQSRIEFRKALWSRQLNCGLGADSTFPAAKAAYR